MVISTSLKYSKPFRAATLSHRRYVVMVYYAWFSLCPSVPQTVIGISMETPSIAPRLDSCDSDLRLGISVTLCWRGKIIEFMSTRLWSYTVTPTLPNTSPPTPPWWSLNTLIMTPPTQVPSIVSRQRGGLAETAAICRKHCAGHTLAASGSLISCTQLFPFVTVDCGWALCWVRVCEQGWGLGPGA